MFTAEKHSIATQLISLGDNMQNSQPAEYHLPTEWTLCSGASKAWLLDQYTPPKPCVHVNPPQTLDMAFKPRLPICVGVSSFCSDSV